MKHKPFADMFNILIGISLLVYTESALIVNAAMRVRSMLDLHRHTEIFRRTMPGQGAPAFTQLLNLTTGEDIVQESSFANTLGETKLKFQETFKDIPVFGATLTATQETNTGAFNHNVKGHIIQKIDEDMKDVTAKLTPLDALNVAKKQEQDSGKKLSYSNEETKLSIYTDSKSVARLVYITSYFAESDIEKTRPFYIIDAKTGEVLDHWQGLDLAVMNVYGRGGNKKTGTYVFGKDYKPLEVTKLQNGVCAMENPSSRVVDMYGETEGNMQTFQFDCNKGFNDKTNGGFSPMNDALYFGGIVDKLYKEWVGVPPIKQQLVLRMHYGKDYENAFWNGKTMAFGDGANTFYPMVCLDVMSHEVSHGFTEQNSGLIYKGQSGGMNEAFSDMAGEAAEFYMKGSNDWLVGADIFKDEGALRYMEDPTQDGASIKDAKEYNNNIDVHHSSGVYNRAFYLLANKQEWDIKKAFQVFALANRIYWAPNSNFDDGACGVKKAAEDLGMNEEDVNTAFSEVGVNTQCESSDIPALQNKIPAINLSGKRGSLVEYQIDIPPDAHSLRLATSKGRGDVDMYGMFDKMPTEDDYEFESATWGNNEQIFIEKPKAGTYYITLVPYKAFSGVSLKGNYLVGNQGR